MPLRIFRYILIKFTSTFVAAVGVFTLLFLMDQASRQVEQLATLAQGIRDFVLSFILLTPHLLAYTVPLAFLLAMIWTLEQMKQERELTAILTTGLSPLNLIIPFQAASVVVFLLVAIMTSYLGPATFRQYNRRIDEMTKRSFLRDLKPGTFFNGIPGTLILVGRFDQASGVINGLLMVRERGSDTAEGQMILAERGTIQSSPEGGGDIVLQLENGTIHPLAAAQPGYRSASFETLTSRISTESRDSGPSTRQVLMAASWKQLRSWVRQDRSANRKEDVTSYVLELNRRLAVPFGVLIYPFLVFPAAVSTGRHGKAAAFSGSLLLYLTTFFLGSIGSNLSQQGIINPVLGAWMADLVLSLAALLTFAAFAFGQRARRAPRQEEPG